MYWDLSSVPNRVRIGYRSRTEEEKNWLKLMRSRSWLRWVLPGTEDSILYLDAGHRHVAATLGKRTTRSNAVSNTSNRNVRINVRGESGRGADFHTSTCLTK